MTVLDRITAVAMLKLDINTRKDEIAKISTEDQQRRDFNKLELCCQVIDDLYNKLFATHEDLDRIRFESKSFKLEAKAKLDALESENATLREELRLIRLNDGPMKNLAELEKDAARFRWLTSQKQWAMFQVNRPMPGIADITDESVDALAGSDATWLNTEDQPANG